MAQLQFQLVALTLQLQDISKIKEKRYDVWCTYCKVDGHFKNQCLVLLQYMSTGAPNPIGQGEGVWCEICRTKGHRPENCHMLQKYQSISRSFYSNYCESVGHEQLDFRDWQLMSEINSNVYRVQGE